jgi:hypothetical protein
MADIERGDLVRDAQPGFFGHPFEWIVEDIFVGSDGNQYAHLCLPTNRNERKTLSVAILCDKRRFSRIRPSVA